MKVLLMGALGAASWSDVSGTLLRSEVRRELSLSSPRIQCGLATSLAWNQDKAALSVPGLVNNHWTEAAGDASVCMIKVLNQTGVTSQWLQGCKVLMLYNEPSINGISAVAAASDWASIVQRVGTIPQGITVMSPAVIDGTGDMQNWLGAFFAACGNRCNAGQPGHVDQLAIHAYTCYVQDGKQGKPCSPGATWPQQVDQSAAYVRQGSCTLSGQFGRPVALTEFAGFLGASLDASSGAPYHFDPLHAQAMAGLLSTSQGPNCISSAYFFAATQQEQTFLAPSARAYNNLISATPGQLTAIGKAFQQLCAA
jgi:hypothetical protein